MVYKVHVLGMGMGNPNTLTQEALQALQESDLIVGSRRLLDALAAFEVPKVALTRTQDIARELRESSARTASVVMSGDVGFYSGATGLYGHLDGMDVHVIPGISSLQYLCAKLRVSWQDAHVISVHGRDCDVAAHVQSHGKTFILSGGSTTAQDICALLVARGLEDVLVSVGERLSYEDERITTGTAAQLAQSEFAALNALLVINPHPLVATTAPGISDDAFARGKVPMTKEEVRSLALCKLRIEPCHTIWDVGAGTGSVSVEAARMATLGQVLSIERNPAAIELLHANKRAFGLTNLRIVEGEAPQALQGLPRPHRVFVGGNGSNLEAILRVAFDANPQARVCITAVTLETVSQALLCIRELGLREVDMVQLSVAKAREAGAYHLMTAQNPVYVISAWGPAWSLEEGQDARYTSPKSGRE